MAVADPWLAPGRTPARPRAPMVSPSESSRMDLPAPVSPVSTFSPGANSSAALSIRTMSRTVRAASIGDSLENLRESFADPGAFVFYRFHMVALQEIISVPVPLAARIVGAQNGGRRLGFVVDAERVIGLGQALQRLGDLRGALVLEHHPL